MPDTNAMLHNPALEEWEFGPRFTLLLLPTFVTELDELKYHRNPSLAEKASKVVTRIKGYRDRGNGDLRNGVTLRRDRSTLRSVAPEPKMDKSLPWLDPLNPDDRILASLIEVMRSHPRSPVTLVTLDLNMQNKAAHAAIPFVEPPHPDTAEPGG